MRLFLALIFVGFAFSAQALVGQGSSSATAYQPSLSCDFTQGALCSGYSLTRASAANYFNVSGVITSATTNTARFHYAYNNSSWVPQGLLYETSSNTNLLAQSNTFTGTNGTQTSGTWTSPDGTADGWTFSDGAASGVAHWVGQNVTTVSSTTYTCSWYVAYGSLQYVQIGLGGGFSSAYSNFDIQHGSVAGASASTTNGITYVGSGVYRIWLTATATSSTSSAYCILYGAQSATSTFAPTYTGASNTFNYFGQQFEQGSKPSSYVATSGSAGSRSVDSLSYPAALSSSPTVLEWTDANTGITQRTIAAAGSFALPSSPTSVIINKICVYAPGTPMAYVNLQYGVGTSCTQSGYAPRPTIAGTGLTQPGPAATWGLNRVVFNDTFASSATTDTTASNAPGFNWYPHVAWPYHVASNWHNFPNTPVAGNMSWSSGLTVNGAAQSVGMISAAPSSASPGWVGNVFAGPMYVEVVMQFSITSPFCPATQGPSWPNAWMFSAEGLTGTNTVYEEADFYQATSTGTLGTCHNLYAFEEWTNSTITSSYTSNPNNADASSHTYGFLFIPSWAYSTPGTGYIAFYKDGVLVASQTYTAGSTYSLFDTTAFPMMFGPGCLATSGSKNDMACTSTWPTTFTRYTVWQQ